MSDVQRGDYDRLLTGFKNRQIYGISGINGADASSIRQTLDAVFNDNAELYGLYPDAIKVEVNSRGRTVVTPRFANCNTRRFEAEVDKIIKSASGLSNDYEKVLFVKDFIGDNVIYDYECLKAVKEPADRRGRERDLEDLAVAFTAYGAIVNRKAACDGIAKAVCCLLRRMGVQCTVLNGTGRNNGEPHSWNIVAINGECYHLDVTNDLLRKEFYYERTYHFFLITDAEMNVYFTQNEDCGLNCNSIADSYYVHNGLRFTNVEQLRRYVLDGAFGEVLSVQYVGEMSSTYIEELLKFAAERNMSGSGKQYIIQPFAGGKYFMLVKGKYEIPKRRNKGV